MSDDLIERLNMRLECEMSGAESRRNPDGPEAAEALATAHAEIERLRDERDEARRIEAAADSTYTHWRDRAIAAEPTVERLREALTEADDAIAEYIRYLDGGEMRGSYDGKPERDALRKAGHATRRARSLSQAGERKP